VALGTQGFFLGDLLRTELPTGITFSQPFRRGASRWCSSTARRPALAGGPTLSDLESDPRVRGASSSGSSTTPPEVHPVLRHAAARRAERSRCALDPEGTDAALHQMVVVGHSQVG
jgi:hypothetical protein